MPQYKFYYFDILGLGEQVRLALVQAGVPFEDIRLKREDWPKYKEEMPFGQVPVLEVDGKKLSQSAAILRYIGKQHGLEAENAWDQAVGDELATSWTDVVGQMGGLFSESDPAAKKKKFDEFVDELVKVRLRFFNEHLSKSKSGFIAGDKVTWCDFTVYSFLNTMKGFFQVPLTGYDHLEKYLHKIENLPKIKQWQADHSNVPFSIVSHPLELDLKKMKEEMKKLKEELQKKKP